VHQGLVFWSGVLQIGKVPELMVAGNHSSKLEQNGASKGPMHEHNLAIMSALRKDLDQRELQNFALQIGKVGKIPELMVACNHSSKLEQNGASKGPMHEHKLAIMSALRKDLDPRELQNFV
jgi:hypothetical protein